jgi:polyhydroxybutyrate depolymerase
MMKIEQKYRCLTRLKLANPGIFSMVPIITIILWLSMQPLTAYAELLVDLTIEHDGRTRFYDLQVPGNVGGQPAALVLDLHALTLTKTNQRKDSRFDRLAEREGFFVAFPNGVARRWNNIIGDDGIDDVGFLRALVAQLSSEYNIDPDRVYATGLSGGGGMVYRLACEAADLFAAYSTVSMAVSYQNEPNCNPSRPVPILSIHGLTDALIPYEGDSLFLSAADSLEFWRGKNSCNGPVEREDFGSEAWCDADHNCRDDVQTVMCTVTGGYWPYNHIIYNNTAGLNLAELSWNFFKLFKLAGPSPGFQINTGHSGAWFYPPTSGQGQFIDVVPENQTMFLSWFTYTDAASANPTEQRWLTALGNYSGNSAVLDLYETLGGKFDDPQTVTTNKVGEVTVTFNDCEQGQMAYDIPAENLKGSFPMQRVIAGSGNVCEDRSVVATEAVDINAGMNGAWFDPATSGQGFFIDSHPDPEGGHLIFVSWFTYGNNTASGQRWLTALGSFTGSVADIDVHETTGGSFDDPQAPSTTKVGTMSIDFTDCSNAQLSYSLPADPATGDIAITRVIAGGQALCEELAGAN